ncbi:MAG: hypothetical protein MUE46_15725 [Xanthomonadales bacterium]|jgi:hypothetical protein|nr:hypothetical protein [Xanthomonadales bacterium]
MLEFKPQSPKRIDAQAAALLAYLGLDASDARHLKFTRPDGFDPEPKNCHLNVWCQLKRGGGSPLHGWVIAQDKAKLFAEAIFHTVWQTPEGRVSDITPREDFEKRLLFVPDRNRTITLSQHEGRPAIITFDNVRMLGSRLITPLTRTKIAMQDGFAERYGLWPW